MPESRGQRAETARPAIQVPDVVFPTVAKILWNKVRRGDLTEERAREIGNLVIAVTLAVHPSAPLLDATLDFAMRTGRTVYESLPMGAGRAWRPHRLGRGRRLEHALNVCVCF